MITVSHQGENAITVAPGANNELKAEDLEEAEEPFAEADYMLVQLETPLETVLKAVTLCKDFQTRVILNPAPAAELPGDLLAKVDIITPNETEAEKLTGIVVSDESSAARAAEELHQRGIETVIITLGSQGAYLSEQVRKKQKMIPGFQVKAVDTTAAGDVFNGQLAVALAEGLDLEESVVLAHAAAALSVQTLGAQSSVPRREETDKFLEDRSKIS
jgi:ribokinase